MTHKEATGPRVEEFPVRKYRVLSARCVWGAQGEVIDKAFAPGVESSLLKAGTLELAPVEPAFVASSDEPEDRPLKSADKEG